jgi:helicase MOV-10
MPLNIDGPVIPSSRPPTWSGIRWINILPKFDPPKALIDAAFQPSPAAALKAVKRLMPVKLNLNMYGAWFQALLYIEGVQKQRDLDRLFTRNAVELTPHNERYELKIEGIANGRPSVLVGDYIHARRSGDAQDNAWYQGRVHSVVHDVLSLHFSDKFSNYRGSKYDIRFIYNRVPERRKHQAVTGSYKPMRALFPDKAHISYNRVTRTEVEAVNPINRDINENYEQRETLAAILKQPPGSVPFVIFGP